jgi:hypothetical protein
MSMYDDTYGALVAPGVQTPPTDDVELALDAILAASDGYEHAEEYDSINLWEQNRLSREGRTLRQADIEFESNLCSPVIDAVNDRLLISSVTATAGADTDTGASDAATKLVTQIWDANELDTRYRSWNRNALRDGDAYIIVWPDQSFEPGSELSGDIDEAPAGGPIDGVNITYADPRCGRMFYDPENPRRKLFFAQLWEMTLKGEKQPRIRLNVFYADRIEKWISPPGDQRKTGKKFVPFLDPDRDDDNDYPGSGGDEDNDPAPTADWPMPNPYGAVPVFHLRTEYEYGDPEHKNAFAPQDALSRLIEMMMVVVEFNGYPQRYALQQADSLGTQSIREDPLAEHSPADYDHDIAMGYSTTQVDAAAISNETGSNYEASPGGMQVYKGFESVGSFTTAIPTVFLEPMREFALLISASTSTPIWKFQGLGGQTPSGEALRIAEMPLVQKVMDRMAMFGGTWRDVMEFALLVLDHAAKVVVQWANPATSDLAEVWQLVKLKIELGVPRDVALMQAGVSEAQAQEWAKTYADVFAEAEYQQGRARMYIAQADLLTQQAVAAKIANGVPQDVALIESGYAEADVRSWFADREQELSLGRKIQMFEQITQGLQQLGVAVGTDIISRESANAIVTELFSELLPDIPEQMFEVEPDAEPTVTLPGPGSERFPTRDPLPDDQAGVMALLPPAGADSSLPAGTPREVHIPFEDQ